MNEVSRLDALVHYVCAQCGNPARLGAAKLNKVLWYADVFAFAHLGSSITGATYVKRQFGPAPRNIMESRARLAKAGAILEKTATFAGYSQVQFIALRDPDISMFTGEQISLVDKVVHAICFDHAAASISQLSHDPVWEAAAIGEEIPLAAGAFAGNIGEIDEDDMAWAAAEIDRIESVSI